MTNYVCKGICSTRLRHHQVCRNRVAEKTLKFNVNETTFPLVTLDNLNEIVISVRY